MAFCVDVSFFCLIALVRVSGSKLGAGLRGDRAALRLGHETLGTPAGVGQRAASQAPVQK